MSERADQTWRVECADALAFLRGLESESVDAVITDPPYSSGGQFRGDRMLSTSIKYQSTDAAKVREFTGDNRDQRSFLAWCTMWMDEVRRILRPGGVAFFFTDWRQLPTVSDAVQCAGMIWRGVVVWDKVSARPVPDRFSQQAEFGVWCTNGPRESKPGPESVYLRGVFSFSAPKAAQRAHATQKPTALMRELVRIVPVGGLVVDPFVGSGSTGMACVETGRRFIGCDVSPEWAGIASNRIAAAVPLMVGAMETSAREVGMFDGADEQGDELAGE